MSQWDCGDPCPRCHGTRCVVSFKDKSMMDYETRVCRRCAHMWTVYLPEGVIDERSRATDTGGLGGYGKRSLEGFGDMSMS
jgi:hypothetical protein